jgi:hypothetical protein
MSERITDLDGDYITVGPSGLADVNVFVYQDGDCCGVALTVEQVDELIALLEAAKRGERKTDANLAP